MSTKLLSQDEFNALFAQDSEAALNTLREAHPSDVAEWLEQLDLAQAIALLTKLGATQAATILDERPVVYRAQVLSHLPADVAADILAHMSSDERADVVQSLSPELATSLMQELDKTSSDVAQSLRKLLAYAPETAGGLMSTDYVAFAPETKVWEAIEKLREYGAKEAQVETFYAIYVVAFGNKLVGVVSLKDVLLSEAGKMLSEIMTEDVVWVSPQADQEEVAKTIAKYDLSALPVVNEHGAMLGVVTVDDVMDVVIKEATEDAQRMGAVEPTEFAYFQTDFITFFRKRVSWLVALFLGELLTTYVMRSYETDLAATMELMIFIPLIISSGGNSGSQSSSLVIRALALGQVRPADWRRIIVREIGIGASLGLVLGILGFVRALASPTADHFMGVWWKIPLAIFGSIVCVVSIGTLLGSLLPLLMKRLGFDPAVSSTPFIASLVDVFGLAAYFSISRLILAV